MQRNSYTNYGSLPPPFHNLITKKKKIPFSPKSLQKQKPKPKIEQKDKKSAEIRQTMYTREKDGGWTRRAVGGDSILVLSIRRRVREERGLDWIERWGSEEAFGWGERVVESKEKSWEEIQQRKTEEFWLEEQRSCCSGRYLPHRAAITIYTHFFVLISPFSLRLSSLLFRFSTNCFLSLSFGVKNLMVWAHHKLVLYVC